MSVFLDAGVLVAFANRDDRLHEEAATGLDRVRRGVHGAPYTSDYVLAESYNFVRQKVKAPGPADAIHALAFGGDGAAPLVAEVLRVHPALFDAAYRRYRSEWDAGLSLTDWTTVELMERDGIEHIATFDGPLEGFAEGVVARPEG